MTTVLSERELQILRLVAEGFSNRQIAGMLDISENTVKVHVRNIFAKIHVASRTEASMYAVRNGLLHDLPQPGETIPSDPPLNDDAHVPVVSNVRRHVYWWVMGGVLLLCILVVGGIWVQGDRYQVSQPLKRTPEAQRWSQLAPFPTRDGDVQMVTVAGQLYAVGGHTTPRLLHYDVSQGAWQSAVEVAFLNPVRASWSDATGAWFVETVTNIVWHWDGLVWRNMGRIPDAVAPLDVVRLAGNIVVLDGADTRVWVYDGTWLSFEMPMTYGAVAQFVVVNDVIYLFGDAYTVWRSLDQGRTWHVDGQLVDVWRGGVAVPVLDAIMLMRDGWQSIYTSTVGEGERQVMPMVIGSDASATIWQMMVVIWSADAGRIDAYQFIFQSFMPMMQ